MKILLLLSIFFLVYCSSTPSVKNNTLEVQGTIYYSNDKEDSVKLELRNNTDTAVKFWIMSCSWNYNWVFEKDSIYIKGLDCNSNVLIKTTLELGKTMTFKGAVHLPETIQSSNFKKGIYKVGFILVRENEVQNFPEFQRILNYKINNRKDLIFGPVF